MRNSFKKVLLRHSLFLVIIIPTSRLDYWKTESYSSISPNKVYANDKGLQIKVENSASPLFYLLETETSILSFKVIGHLKGLPKFSDVSLQGHSGSDDFPFRIGFIIPGKKKLSGLRKVFAPEWIKKLYQMLPEKQGLDRIVFYNLVQNPDLLGTSRIHPNSDLISENFIQLVKTTGPFEISYKLKNSINAVAIWISVDGDDTQSEYDVEISEISLTTL